MPRSRVSSRSKPEPELPLGLPSLDDGNNSDEYIDTSLGRCGTSDVNDDEYIKASHDLLSRSTEELIPRNGKRLRFNLDDDSPLFSGNSSTEEKSPWIENQPKRRRKSAVVKRFVRDSDSDEGLSADRAETMEVHRPEKASSSLLSVPFAMIQRSTLDTQTVSILPDQHGFICHLCKYSAKMAYLMENHMKTTHLNEQPYMCLTCRKSFHQRGTAMTHIRIRHPHGSQMIIDQETENRQTEECNKLLQNIYRCHVCEAKSSVHKGLVKNPDGQIYVCSLHAKNYSLGVNVVQVFQD